jgi:T5orf172 domain
MVDSEYLDEHFYSRFYNLDLETIFRFKEMSTDGSINNVIVGRHSHCYGLMLIDDEQDVEYHLYYINGDNGLCGDLLKLDLRLEDRDLLLTVFSNHIADTYGLDTLEVFNTFQDMTRTMAEQIGYLTITVNEMQKFKDGNPVVIAKNVRGIIFVPLYFHKDLYEFIFNKVDKQAVEAGTDHVYLIFNNRNKYVKIGKSKNPLLRERTLQAEEPEIFMIAVWRAHAQLERILHKRYAAKRVRGEWFDLSFKEMKDLSRFVDSSTHLIQDLPTTSN